MEIKAALSRSAFSTNSALRETRIARWVSNGACPPAMAAALIALVAGVAPGPDTGFWAVASICANVVAPSVFVVWLWRTGQVSDLHLTQREQRLKPALCAIACAVFLAIGASLGNAPVAFRQCAEANLALLTAMAIITLRWKISAHCSAAAAVTTAGAVLLGPATLPSFALVLIVAWARVRLQKHDLWQCLAGITLGVVSAAALVHP